MPEDKYLTEDQVDILMEQLEQAKTQETEKTPSEIEQDEQKAFDRWRLYNSNFIKNILFPLSLRFKEGEIPLSSIQKESKKITDYIGRTGEVVVKEKKIGNGVVYRKKDTIRIKLKNLPKKNRIHVLFDCWVKVTCVIDSIVIPAIELKHIKHGSIVQLKKPYDDPVDICVNGHKIAKGELFSAGDHFAVVIKEFINPENEIPYNAGYSPQKDPVVHFAVIAGETIMTAHSAYLFREQSFIDLDNPVSNFFPVLINGRPAFETEIVQQGNNYAAKIFDAQVFSAYSSKDKIDKQEKDEYKKPDRQKDHVPFHFIKEAEATGFFKLLQDEHPQVMAFILSYLPPDISRIALLSLPEELQADVTLRIANMECTTSNNTTIGAQRMLSTDQQILYHIEEYVKDKITLMPDPPVTEPGGLENVVTILKGIKPEKITGILSTLEEKNAELIKAIKKQLQEKE